MTPISARSRRPTSQGTSPSEPSGRVTFFTTLMLSSSRLACSSLKTGVFPRLTTCFGAAHRMRLVDGEDLADDEPVEQHADCREVLLDGRPGRCALFHCRIAG